MFPTEILESKTQRKILRVLAEKNKQYTLEEIAEMCHRSKSAVSRALKGSEKYPFIKKKHISGSKELLVSLNPESKYSEALRIFFNEEKNRERQNGTIPVDIWNLLEDITDNLSRKIDGFVDLFLFGSYATGEYHSKSDIDLILLHRSEKDVSKEIHQRVILNINNRKARELADRSKNKIFVNVHDVSSQTPYYVDRNNRYVYLRPASKNDENAPFVDNITFKSFYPRSPSTQHVLNGVKSMINIKNIFGRTSSNNNSLPSSSRPVNTILRNSNIGYRRRD